MMIFPKINRLFLQAFSGKDNETLDIGRILWAAGVASYIVFAGFVVYHSKGFDGITYGTGFAAVLAAGGVTLKLKNDTEPPKKTTEEDK
jgi:hypothetical protein